MYSKVAYVDRQCSTPSWVGSSSSSSSGVPVVSSWSRRVGFRSSRPVAFRSTEPFDGSSTQRSDFVNRPMERVRRPEPETYRRPEGDLDLNTTAQTPRHQGLEVPRGVGVKRDTRGSEAASMWVPFVTSPLPSRNNIESWRSREVWGSEERRPKQLQ